LKLSEEQIERFRRTGIRLDREGRFWHEGATVGHEGLHRALLRWLDVLPDGRPILRLDERRYAYVDVDDAFLLGVSVEWRNDRAFVHLNDGSTEELAYDTLETGPDDALYCLARDGRLRARLTTSAYYSLAEKISSKGDGFVLEAAGTEYSIR